MYVIRRKSDNALWSRNHFATPTSCPDLYKTEANAQRQIDKGKIGTHNNMCTWPTTQGQSYWTPWDCEILEVELEVVRICT